MLHKTRQLLNHLTVRRPFPPPAWVNRSEAGLFTRMAPPDQYEALEVVKTLQAWGYASDRELLIAALLHDVGKSPAKSGARFRVAVSVFETIAPWFLRWLADHSRTIHILVHHPEIGAEMAAEAGLPRRVVALIGGHHSAKGEPRLEALRRADALH